ncbi:choice-of-anchor V domain-containing protein [Hyphococcus lacteus]|uniref:Choice-of-anchor V domain-containing protein n=1 Tax=Hyphococcus lacteus TaxID=3143536 RepID=A0ABV3Z8W7_9PROT
MVITAMPAAANPGGAPWGASDPQSIQNCHSCHFDGKPQMNSMAISLDGLPDRIDPGATYTLNLRFAKPAGTVAGFLASASAGRFSATDEALEVNSGQIRSTEPKAGTVPRHVKWQFEWKAPDNMGEVIIMIAVNAANDDQSSFGDEIHFRTFTAKSD